MHDSPQQNGVVEQANHTLVEHACALLIGANLPRALWAEAVSHATYLKNCSPTRALVNKTPYEAVHGCKPNLSDLHCFGCKVFVRLENVGKLDAQAKEARFVGYNLQSKGYRIYWAETHRVSIERNVRFTPEEATQTPGDITQTPDIVEFKGETGIVDLQTKSLTPEASPADIPLLDSPLTTPPASPKSRTAEIIPASHPTHTATAHPPGYYARKSFPAAHANTMWEVKLADDKESSSDADAMDAVEHAIASIENDEPSVDKALRGPNADKWHTAMDEEDGHLGAC